MRISAIIPTYNSERTLASCLQSLRQQSHPDTEIIVVDNGSSDSTDQIAQHFADKVVSQGPERCAQRNRGAAEATGNIVVFFDSDMVIEPEVLADIASAFAQDADLGAITIPERSFGDGFLAQCRALEKSLYVGNDEVEAPRAFRKEIFSRIGGWDETLTAAEDWELADRTRANDVRIGRVDSWIWHDEGRINLATQFRKKQYYGRWVAEYLHRAPEAGRHVSRKSVLKKLGGTFRRHPGQTTGMITLKVIESAGLARGMHRARRTGFAGVSA
jgi:glycosyltransferase involved in cell wall biosynthesis